jgi:thiol-disulfide isomerase/thioredoxin
MEAKISGIITHPNDSIVKIMDNRYKTLKEVKLDSLGGFEFTIEFNEAKRFNFGHIDEATTLYLDHGMDLRLTLDYNMFDETVKYEGVGSDINNYNASIILQQEDIDSNLDYDPLIINDLARYLNHNHFLRDSSLALLNRSLLDKNSVFFKNEKNRILYNSYTTLLKKYIRLKSLSSDSTKYSYSWNGERKVKYLIRPDSIVIPEGYLSFINNINIESEEVLEQDDFIKTLCDFEYWLETELPDELSYNERTQHEISNMLNIINKRFTGSKAKNIVIKKKIDKYVSRRIGIGDLQVYFDQYFSTLEDTTDLYKYEDTYKKLKNLKKGSPAPIFIATDSIGNKVSLSNYSGKFVYIDIWATWCGPCKKEIPYLEELQKKFVDKDIVFMSVSLDSDSSAWAQMLKDKKMQGVQLLAINDWKSDIAKNYIVKSIPRFVFIDPEGMIIDQNAGRPSKTAEELITEALGVIN